MNIFSRNRQLVRRSLGEVGSAVSPAPIVGDPERLVTGVSTWRDQFNPLRGITMEGAIGWLEQAQRGEFADIQWAYSFIERRDADLLAIVERRTGALLQMDWNIKTVEKRFKTKGLEFDAALAADQQATLRGVYDGFTNLYAAIEHLAMATFRGFAHVQYVADGELLKTLNVLNQWNLLRDGTAGDWYWNPAAAQTISRNRPAADRLNPEAYLIRANPRPVNEVALIKFLRHNLSAKDWDGFLEIYGIPAWVVIMPANVPAEKEAAYRDAAESIAGGEPGALPNGADAKAADQPRGISPFEAHLRYWSEKLVLAGTGGLLTMLTAPGSGTLAGSAHQEAFDLLARAEAQRISEIFQRSLDRHILAQAFPGRPQLAYFDIAAEEEQDVGDILDHCVKIAQAGGEIDWSQISEKTGYRITLKPPAPIFPPQAYGIESPNRQSAILNRKSADATSTLVANATRLAVHAQRADMLPLAQRLYALLEIEDPAALAAAAKTLADDLPGMATEILANPALATIIENTLGPALLNGMEAAAVPAKGAA